jgi:outer membrane protein assembly factor BamE (lipoprotein component of BamABCDE complex)
MKIPAWIATAATAIGVALLPACDAVNLQEIKPGITSASEVKTRMGEPGFQYWNNDGTATWEYSRQPSGTQCYMITFGNDQIVKSMEQVLNDKNYAKVRDGLSKDDVRRLLGAPGSKVVFDNLREEIWEWRVEGMPPTEETYFMVHFDTGHGGVKKTSKRIAMRG